MSVEAPATSPPQGGFELTAPVAVARRPRPLFTLSRPRAWDRVRAYVALVSVPVLGLLLCVAGTQTLSLLPQSVRPIEPTSMAGPFAHIGFSLSEPEVAAAIVALLVTYVLAVRWVDRLSARAVILAIVALNVIVLAGPPLFSTDVFSYQAYARMFAVFHTSPYTHGPNSVFLPNDQFLALIGAKWISTPSVYGPLFTFLSSAWAAASVPMSEFLFKLIAALASGGTLYVIWLAAKRRGLDPVRGIALFGLNPLVTMYGVGGGHNDLLMLLLTTCGIYSVLLRRERAGGALIAAGTAIKLTGGILLPFALLAEPRNGDRRSRRRFLAGFAGLSVVVAGASFAVFGTTVLHLPNTLQSVQDQGEWQSVPGFIFAVARINVTHGIRIIFDLALGGWLLWLLREVWQQRMDWIEGAAWATLAVLMTAWAFLPWYVCWLLPLVALSRSRRLWTVAIVMSMFAGVIMLIGTLPPIPLLNV